VARRVTVVRGEVFRKLCGKSFRNLMFVSVCLWALLQRLAFLRSHGAQHTERFGICISDEFGSWWTLKAWHIPYCLPLITIRLFDGILDGMEGVVYIRRDNVDGIDVDQW
jgi:hypothetical protein